MQKCKHLKSTLLIASPEQNQLNSDAKLFLAKLHESIIRSHFISLLQIYCSGTLSHFHSKKHSHYKPPPFCKEFNSSHVHNAVAWHIKSLVQLWGFFFQEVKMCSAVFDLQIQKNSKIYTFKSQEVYLKSRNY